jgi:multiple sugar transport system permease protein
MSTNGQSRRRQSLLPYYMILPGLLLILVILIYPIAQGVITSFFRPKGLLPGLGEFVGLENYGRLLNDESFWNAFRVTIMYVLGCLAGILAMGLATALLLNRRFKGRGVGRVLMTTPWAMPEVAAALIWIWMLNPDVGIVNLLLSRFGLIEQHIRWLNQVEWALPTILVVTIWKLFPLASIVLLAALQGVPEELYEAAAIDGAGALQSFLRITIPGIHSTLLLLALLITVWSIKRFALIWITTQGGPVGRTETLVILVYRSAFKFFDLGYAAAIGVVGLTISILVTIVFFWLQSRYAD